jgi:hypothetical protein
MLVFKGALLGLALFLIGAVIYTLVAPRLIRARGIGMISTNSPFLWLAFAGSITTGYLISIHGLWILQGVLLGLAMFIVGTAGYGIAYNRRLMKLYPQPPGAAVGISVRHLWLKLVVVLICSVCLGLVIVAVWPTNGISVQQLSPVR